LIPIFTVMDMLRYTQERTYVKQIEYLKVTTRGSVILNEIKY